MERAATVVRQTKETNIELTLGLDGGEVVVDTGVGFFDHMLTALAVHGGFGLQLKAEGDWNVDCHHTVEDTGRHRNDSFASRRILYSPAMGSYGSKSRIFSFSVYINYLRGHFFLRTAMEFACAVSSSVSAMRMMSSAAFRSSASV